MLVIVIDVATMHIFFKPQRTLSILNLRYFIYLKDNLVITYLTRNDEDSGKSTLQGKRPGSSFLVTTN